MIVMVDVEEAEVDVDVEAKDESESELASGRNKIRVVPLCLTHTRALCPALYSQNSQIHPADNFKQHLGHAIPIPFIFLPVQNFAIQPLVLTRSLVAVYIKHNIIDLANANAECIMGI